MSPSRSFATSQCFNLNAVTISTIICAVCIRMVYLLQYLYGYSIMSTCYPQPILFTQRKLEANWFEMSGKSGQFNSIIAARVFHRFTLKLLLRSFFFNMLVNCSSHHLQCGGVSYMSKISSCKL